MVESPDTPGSRLKALFRKRYTAYETIQKHAGLRGAGVTVERFKAFLSDAAQMNEAEGLAIAAFYGLTPNELRRVLVGAAEQPFIAVDDTGFSTWGSVGVAITRARGAANLTQTELSAKCGIAQSQISLLGKSTGRPRLTTLRKIANALQVNWKTLVPKQLAAHYYQEALLLDEDEDQKLLEDLADVL